MAQAPKNRQDFGFLPPSALRESLPTISDQVLHPLFLHGDIQFHEGVILNTLQMQHVEPGRVLCSLRVPPRIIDAADTVFGGVLASLVDDVGAAVFIAMDGRVRVSVDLNVSIVSSAKLGDVIEIDARVLKYGTRVGTVGVDIRNKATGELVAQGRHTMYYPTSRL